MHDLHHQAETLNLLGDLVKTFSADGILERHQLELNFELSKSSHAYPASSVV